MENERLKNKIKSNVRESIAISNIRDEINMNRIKNKKIFYSVLSSCALFIICGAIFINKNDFSENDLENKLAILNNNIITQNTNNESEDVLSTAKVLDTVDKDKIKYVNSAFSFAYKPTIENLYKNADVVIIGTFNSDLKTYTQGLNIRTETKFNTSKVLKNNTDLDIKDTAVFNRLGGVMTLSEYMKNNETIREDEFTDIPVNERSNYYVIQKFAPDNKLDFYSKTNDNKYILFLSYRDGKLGVNLAYYGIREINDENKIYDYDSKQYVSSELIEK